MRMFLDHKKLYFVFANEEERYYLDNLMQVNTTLYLWKELRESRYNNIFYITKSGEKYRVEILDNASKQKYNEFKSKSGLLKAKKNPGIPSEKKSTEIEQIQLLKWLDFLLTNSSSADSIDAVIFDLIVFNTLYSDPENHLFLDNIIEKQRKGASIILLIPSRLQKEHHEVFIDARGRAHSQLMMLDSIEEFDIKHNEDEVLRRYVFQKKEKLSEICQSSLDSVFLYTTSEGNSLCGNLTRLIKSEKNLEIFNELKKDLGSQFVDLSIVPFSQIEVMLQCVCLTRGKLWPSEVIASFADALFVWYYLPEINWNYDVSQRLTDSIGGLFPNIQKRGHRIGLLYDKLCSSEGWNEFKKMMEILSGSCREEYSDLLMRIDRRSVENQSHIYLDNARLLEIAELQWPAYEYDLVTEINPTLKMTTREKWSEMQSDLLIPRNCSVSQTRIAYLEAYFKEYEVAMKRKDFDTACRAMNAMLYGGRCLYSDETPLYLRRYEEYSKYLYISGKYHDVVNEAKCSKNGDLFEQGLSITVEQNKQDWATFLKAKDMEFFQDSQQSKVDIYGEMSRAYAVISDTIVGNLERKTTDRKSGIQENTVQVGYTAHAGLNVHEATTGDWISSDDDLSEQDAYAKLTSIQQKQFD